VIVEVSGGVFVSGECVAYASDGSDVLAGGTEFLSQRGHVHVDCAVDYDRLRSHRRLDQLVALENSTSRSDYRRQKAKLRKR
jgi:hypothetical protein